MRAPRVSKEDLEHVAEQLAGPGWGVVPGFLPAPAVGALACECRALWEEGAFRAARVGIGPTLELRPEVRTDRVHWLREPDLTEAQRGYLERIEALRVAINRKTYLGLFDFECHLTVYPPASYYRRHLDRFRGAGHRVVSCILYLNEDWKEEAGGCLRLFLPSAPADTAGVSAHMPQAAAYHDVLPLAGTLVTFLSGVFEHEVLSATRERLSITGWLRSRV